MAYITDYWLDLSISQSKFLKSLCEIDPLLSYGQVSDPQGSTCAWIWKDPTFRDWQHSAHARLLWISGFVGSGKSVLVKQIVRDFSGRCRSQLQKPVQTQGGSVDLLAFAFCSDKEARGIDAASVLRSILLQYVSNDTSLFQFLEEGSWEDPRWQASVVDLTAAILNLVLRSSSINFWIVIDGLDEMHDHSGTTLVHQLFQILDGDLMGRLRILLTDRQGPESRTDRTAPDLSLIDMDIGEVHEDVKNYISNLVTRFCVEHAFPQHLIRTVQSDMVSRSQGVFLLALLNWTNLTQGRISWSRRSVLRRLEELHAIPSTIQHLYCDQLLKVPQDLRPLLRTMFMWLLVARQPLTVDELNCAVSVEIHHASYDDLNADLVFDLARVLRQYCQPFLKIAKSQEVQFRHQSFKTFLLQRSQVPESEIIWREFKLSVAACEYEVNKVLLTVLRFKNFTMEQIVKDLGWEGASSEQTLNDPALRIGFKIGRGYLVPLIERYVRRWPMLLHCIKHWPDSFQTVQGNYHMAEKATSFFLSPNLTGYRFLSMPYHLETRQIKTDNYSISTRTPPLHALIQFGDFIDVFEGLVALGEDINGLDSDFLTPLHWALLRSREKVFHFLMQHPKTDPNYGMDRCDKPLHVCIDPCFDDLELLRTFLSFSTVNVNVRGKHGKTALHKIMERPNSLEPLLDIIFVRDDLLFNLTDDEGIVPLIRGLSSGSGQRACLKLLKIAPGLLNVTVTDQNKTNALSLASLRGWVEVTRMLKGRDRSQLFSSTNDGMNPLTRAAFFGQKRYLHNVLEHLSIEEVRRLSNSGRFTLVSLCAQQDWEDVVQLLLEDFGLDSNEQDTCGRTVLHWAAVSGWKSISTFDFEKLEPFLNTQDVDGCTALHLAAEMRNLDAVRLLLAQGAICLVRDKYGKTAAHTAAEADSKAILDLILDLPVREFGRDCRGCSLLHLIATWEWPLVVQKYIKTKSPIIDIRNSYRQTPLHYAAICGNVGVVESLLHAGARVEQRDSVGCTPLHHALRQGHRELSLVLLQSGADLNQLDGFGRTSLQLSIGYKNVELFISDILRIRSAAGNNADGSKKIALYIAALLGHARKIMYPLDNGAVVEGTDFQGFAPLLCAIAARELPAVEIRVNNASANPSLRDDSGCTGLDPTAALKHSTTVAELQSHGACHSLDFNSNRGSFSREESSTYGRQQNWALTGPLCEEELSVKNRAIDAVITEDVGFELQDSIDRLEYLQFLVHTLPENCNLKDKVDFEKVKIQSQRSEWEQWLAEAWIGIEDPRRTRTFPLKIMNAQEVKHKLGCVPGPLQSYEDFETIRRVNPSWEGKLNFDSSAWDPPGWTSIHEFAIDGVFDDGVHAICKGCIIYVRNGRTEAKAWNTLHVCEEQDRSTFARMILGIEGARECDFDVNIAASDMATPLQVAVLHKNIGIARTLVRLGADMSTRDSGQRSLLHIAAKQNDFTMVQWLLRHGVTVNAQDSDGVTALHVSIHQTDFAIASLLLEYDADPNLKDKNDDTPLHLCSRRSVSDISALLLHWGADPTLRNKHGATPILLPTEDACSGRSRI